MDFLREFYGYLKARKKRWLIPLYLMFFLLGGLLYLSQGAAIAPFMYTIF